MVKLLYIAVSILIISTATVLQLGGRSSLAFLEGLQNNTSDLILTVCMTSLSNVSKYFLLWPF